MGVEGIPPLVAADTKPLRDTKPLLDTKALEDLAAVVDGDLRAHSAGVKDLAGAVLMAALAAEAEIDGDSRGPVASEAEEN